MKKDLGTAEGNAEEYFENFDKELHIFPGLKQESKEKNQNPSLMSERARISSDRQTASTNTVQVVPLDTATGRGRASLTSVTEWKPAVYISSMYILT